jgi:histone deacetylase complex regulatory component SIN3
LVAHPANRITTQVLIDQVARLLYSSIDLVEGFNVFLPAGWEVKSAQNDSQDNAWTVTITSPQGSFIRRFSHALIEDGEEHVELSPSAKEEFQRMVALVQSIQERYSNAPQIYEEFLRLINPGSNIGSRQVGPFDMFMQPETLYLTQDIFLAVKSLLHDSPDLVERFQMLVID